MHIEWSLFFTHLLGFLLTVWILKRYAWKPLLALMEERRARIENEFADIDKQKANVADLTAQYQAKLKDIEAERRVEIVKAVDEGKRVAEEIKHTAQAEIKDLQAKHRAELEREIAKAKVQLKQEMVTITMSAAEKVLHERLDNQKQRELIGRFIDDVQKA